MKTIEEWRDIPGYEGRYQVSNTGNVKSLGLRKRVLKPFIHYGYAHVCLHNERSKRLLRIHRLVAMAFIPNNSGLPEINHIDGNRLNNVVENLEWVTTKQNAEHRVKLGRQIRGEANKLAKLNEFSVLTILTMIPASGWNCKKLANYFPVSGTTIRRLVSGETWKEIADAVGYSPVNLKGKSYERN